jgi:hypothetical protein
MALRGKNTQRMNSVYQEENIDFYSLQLRREPGSCCCSYNDF